MAKPERQPKVGKSRAEGKGAKGKSAKGGENGKPYKEEDLIRGLNHAIRRQALRALHASKTPMGPAQVDAKLKLGNTPKERLSQISYHMKTLAQLRIISLVDEQQVRGAMEHIYASEVDDDAWVRSMLKRTQESDEAELWPEGRQGAAS